jgi:hypothetical protein
LGSFLKRAGVGVFSFKSILLSGDLLGTELGHNTAHNGPHIAYFLSLVWHGNWISIARFRVAYLGVAQLTLVVGIAQHSTARGVGV